jgi:alkyl hydroperoxide reductase subunit AhpF
MLDAATTAQLKTYLANLRVPVELVATLDDSPKSSEMRELVAEVAAQSALLSARYDGTAPPHAQLCDPPRRWQRGNAFCRAPARA